MPIVKELVGDILEMADYPMYDVVVQGCNCKHSMKTGLAPKFAEKWPGCKQADLDTERGAPDKLGTYSAYWSVSSQISVVNMYTQLTDTGRKQGRRDVSYDAIANAFTLLNDEESGFGLTSDIKVLVPLIGSDLGGGDWEIIRAIIARCTPNLDITIVHYRGD